MSLAFAFDLMVSFLSRLAGGAAPGTATDRGGYLILEYQKSAPAPTGGCADAVEYRQGCLNTGANSAVAARRAQGARPVALIALGVCALSAHQPANARKLGARPSQAECTGIGTHSHGGAVPGHGATTGGDLRPSRS